MKFALLSILALTTVSTNVMAGTTSSYIGTSVLEGKAEDCYVDFYKKDNGVLLEIAVTSANSYKDDLLYYAKDRIVLESGYKNVKQSKNGYVVTESESIGVASDRARMTVKTQQTVPTSVQYKYRVFALGVIPALVGSRDVVCENLELIKK